jgi:hypothetical protein
MPQSCRDNEENPNASRLGSQTDRAWLFVPCMHPPIVHHPPCQPPRCSLAIALVVSRPSPRPMHAGSNGLIYWEILWVSTQGQFHTWPLPRSHLQSFLPILLRIRPMNLLQSIHPQPKLFAPKLRVKVLVPAMGINRRNLTPMQTVSPAQRYKKALQFCKAWCLNCERIWTTFVFVWKSWMGRGHNSFKFSQPCMNRATPQMRNQMHSRMNNRSWYHLRKGIWRRKQHQT